MSTVGRSLKASLGDSRLLLPLVALGLIFLSPTIQVDILGNDAALFPLRNPGLVSIPLAFAVAIGVSLLRPDATEERRFLELERRLHIGAD